MAKNKQTSTPKQHTPNVDAVDQAVLVLVRAAKMIAKANGEGPVIVREKLAKHINFDAILGAIDAGDIRAAIEFYEVDSKTGNVTADQTNDAK